ncbi:MAG: IclR family transcriptional regulator [Candidatus Protistobacter heckmanni]|nr:IclR family transcriptional regulator [Candidatus Protistobacter heckmanni]
MPMPRNTDADSLAVKAPAKSAAGASSKTAAKASAKAAATAASKAADAEVRSPRRIQSLEIGFRLVREIESAPRGLSLKDVSAHTGMPRSKAHLYLGTFLSLGLLARDGAGNYRLGPYALQIGLSALRQSGVVDLAEEAMREVQDATAHAVHLAIWGNHGPTIVCKLDGRMKVPMSIQVGYVLPLLTSASGRVFLAYEYPQLLQPILEREQPGAKLADKAVAAVIKDVRKVGMGGSSGRIYEGLAALSCPVLNHRGELCAALTILDTAALLDMRVDGKSAAILRKAAEEISTRLGKLA